MIAVIIKTHRRPWQITRCIESIYEHCDKPYRIYIADDSPLQQPVDLYKDLESDGHDVYLFDSQISVTYARNYLVSQLQDESYVLRIDDDFLFSKETSLSKMVDVLESSTSIGAVSSFERQLGDGKGIRHEELSDKQGFFFRDGRVLNKICVPVESVNWLLTENGVRYGYFDFTRNCLLIKREVFEQVKWREELFIQGEHSAFMLDLKRAGFLLAQTPDSIHCHDERLAKEASYLDVRKSEEGISAMRAFYADEYGIDSIRSLSVEALFEAQNPSYSTVFRIFLRRVARDVRGLWG